MIPKNLHQSVYPLTSKDPKNPTFGTAFIIYADGKFAYLATCAHVVKALGGSDNVLVDNMFSAICLTALLSDDSMNEPGVMEPDLAILVVPELRHDPRLSLNPIVEGNQVTIVSASEQHKGGSKRSFEICETKGELRNKRSAGKIDPIWLHEISVEGDLWYGCSGSPVISDRTTEVIGILSELNKQKERSVGKIILIDELRKIWPEKQSLISKRIASQFFITLRNGKRLLNRLECASESIEVSGFTLNSMLKESDKLRSLLKQTLRLRLLAMDPDGNAIEQICWRYLPEICKNYLRSNCVEFSTKKCFGDRNLSSCTVDRESIKDGMSSLIHNRLRSLVTSLLLIKVDSTLITQLKKHRISENVIKRLHEVQNSDDSFIELVEIKRILTKAGWTKAKKTLMSYAVPVEIKVIDQRLPTGYFIVDRDKEFGVMHAEIELDNQQDDGTDYLNPLFILYKEFDTDWFSTFKDNYDFLFSSAHDYIPRVIDNLG